jgi:hypothetical protein
LRWRKIVHDQHRSRRYALRLPVKYRTSGEREWHEGTTISLSASGAVIDGDMPPRAQHVMIVISLPSAGGCLSGHGRIVSAPAPATRAGQCSFAIAVPHYRLEHCDDALDRLDVLLQEC